MRTSGLSALRASAGENGRSMCAGKVPHATSANAASASTAVMSIRFTTRLIGHRQLAYARSRRGEDRVGKRRHHARRSGLADSARRLDALDEHHVHLRRLADAQHAIIAEVRLLRGTLLKGDLAVKPSRQAEPDPAFHLRSYRVGIDLHATIDCTPHMCGIDGAVLIDDDLDHLRDEAA